MKKILSLIITFCIMSFTLVAFADGEQQQKPFSERLKVIMEEQKSEQERLLRIDSMPKVAVLYINNSKTTYDDEIDKVMLDTLAKSLDKNVYVCVDGQPYIERLSKIGIVDITTAERADIIDAFAGEDIDYAIFMQVDPFIRKDKQTFFTVGKEMTAFIPFKIIDLKNNRYLYNGKFTEIAKDSSMLGDIGNKSVAMKALKKTTDKIASVIDVRLPKEKAVVLTTKK